MENSMKIFQKIKNRMATLHSNSTSAYLFEEIQNTNTKRYMHPYVHCSIIYHSQDKKQLSVYQEWMDKDMIHTYNKYNGILLSNKNNAILPLVIMWVDVEGIMLIE